MAIRTITSFINYKFPISPYNVRIKRVRGIYTGSTANLYLQMHTGTQTSPGDTAIDPPSNGTVPLDVSIPIAAAWANGYDYAFDPLQNAVGPVIFVLSTTAVTLTAATGENLESLSIDIEEYGNLLPSTATTTVNTNASATNQIWASASGYKSLFEIVAYQNSGATAYLKISAKDTPVDGEQPFLSIPILNNKTTPYVRAEFGDVGGNPSGYVQPYQISNDGQTRHQGCTITMEPTAGVFVASGRLTGWKYQAKYL